MGQNGRKRRWAAFRNAIGEHLRETRRLTGLAGLRRLATPPARLVIAPQDIRTSDPSIAADIYAGLFALGARAVRTHGQSVFEIEPPSWLWACELHGFAWLRHLRLAQSALSRANARALLLEWLQHRDRSRRAIGNEPLTNARRLISLLSQSPLLLEGADAEFYRRFMRLLAREAGKVARNYRSGRPDERLLSIVALAFLVVCSEQGEMVTGRVNSLLSQELKAQVLGDGGLLSRNPGAVLELLLDLLPLRQGYIARRTAPPKELLGAIDRMMPMLRMLRHGDGALALFNGMGATAPDLVAAVLAYDDTRSRPLENAPHSGYQRLAGGDGMLAIVDCGQPPAGPAVTHPHAGVLALELSDGGQRIVVNCGTPAVDREDMQRAARQSAAHATLVLGDSSSSSFFERRDRYGRLLAGIAHRPRSVTVEREDHETHVEIRVSHDGYAAVFALRHERQLQVLREGGMVIGLDRLAPAGRRRQGDQPFVLRFHLHPAVRAGVAGTKRRVLLAAGPGRVWQFDIEADVQVEVAESIFFASAGGARRCSQIVVNGHTATASELRWRFTRLTGEAAAEALRGLGAEPPE